MNVSSPSLVDLLGELERSLDVLDFRFQFDEFLMWPFVRVALVHAAYIDAYGLSNFSARGERLSLWDYWSYAFHTITRNPFTAKRGDGGSIMMFASGITNVLRDGAYVNRLHDFLASEHPN